VAYSSVILGTPGIVSYWRLGEASGNALDSKDSSPGTIAGGITRAVTGLLVNDTDKAMQSDGVLGSFVNVPYAANMNVGAQLTLEFWCKSVCQRRPRIQLADTNQPVSFGTCATMVAPMGVGSSMSMTLTR
jgi:hypothetical protein